MACLIDFWNISVRTAAVLPHILPKLVHLPLSYVFLFVYFCKYSSSSLMCYYFVVSNIKKCYVSALNAHAIGALAEVAGAGFNTHLGTILPALLSAMGDENKVKNKIVITRVCMNAICIILFELMIIFLVAGSTRIGTRGSREGGSCDR